MKYLGIDYGKTKLGLAHSEGELASPGEVVNISGLQDALVKIKKVLTHENVEIVIIGMPESGESKKITSKFIAALKHDMLSNIQIIESDETLSTQHGHDAMIDAGVPLKKRGREDAYAAAEILQEYLDRI